MRQLRIAIGLLVLANVAWYAWTHWISPPPPALVEAATEAPPLVLAREAPAAAAPRAAPAAAGNCLSLGPFTDLTDSARASTILRESGFESRQRAAEGVVWRGFWVSLEGVPDRQAAEGVIDRLRRYGIADAYTMPDAGSRNTISLGLFSERERALRRIDDVKALGLEPRLSERERRGTVYWIDVDVDDAARLPDAARLHGDTGRILRLEILPCGTNR